MFEVTITGIRQLQKDLDAAGKKNKRALETAIKVEGFRQLRILRDQIKKGVPGGHPYAAQLSEIARRTKAGRLRKNQIPLYRLARLLRYNIAYRHGDIQMSFGFVSSSRSRLSGSWKKLVLQHAEGDEVDLHRTLYSGSRSELGRRFARIGGRLKKRGDPDARFFFLRRVTSRRGVDLPRRPIIEPFWGAYDDDVRRNIRKNFQRKLRGERI